MTEKGDSGAWIFDENGSLYGMVVATVPSLDLSYAVRAEDLLRDAFPTIHPLTSLDILLPRKGSLAQSLPQNPSLSSALTDIHQWASEVVQIDLITSLDERYHKAPSSVLASSANDSGYYSQQAFESLDDVRAHEQVLLDHATLLQSETRLSPVMLKFVQTTRDRFEACIDMHQHEEELTDASPDLLVAEAIHAYSHRRIEFAQACVEKFVLLTACQAVNESSIPPSRVIAFLKQLDDGEEASRRLYDRELARNWALSNLLAASFNSP